MARVRILRWVTLLLGCIVAPPAMASHLVNPEGPVRTTRATMAVDTVDGVVHVQNQGSGRWTRATRWRIRRAFRLGARRPPPTEAFTSLLLGTSIGPDGNIYVLDPLAGQISVFTPHGSFVRRISRRGRGPTELAGPAGIGWTEEGDLVVSDPGNQRLIVFDTTGTVLRRYPRSLFPHPRRQFDVVDSDEGLIDEAAGDGNLILLRTSKARAVRDTLLVLHRTGGPSDAILSVPRTVGSDAFETVARHYQSRMKWALDPYTGGLWVGSPDSLRFTKIDWNGDTVRIVTADHRASRLSPEDERIIREAMDETGLDREDLDPRRPIFQAIRVLEGGFLAVQITRDPGTPSPLFDIYDPEGVYLGEIDLGFAPHPQGGFGSRHDLVVAPTVGRGGVPQVVGVHLIRPEDGPP